MTESIFSLEGKIALVTGGAQGIGKACAVGMAKAGADVVIADLNDDLGTDVVKEIQALGRRSLYIRCDVTDQEQVAKMVSKTVIELGKLDIAFNNAGATTAGCPTIEDGALDAWREIIDLDLNSVYYCCREEAKVMIPRKYGKIINNASMSAGIVNNVPVNSSLVAYCAAKAGVRQLTRALAIEWTPYNIYVNSISPGYISTPFTQTLEAHAPLFDKILQDIPMGRFAKAEELVGGVIYLASDASSYTTGFDLIMDGGHTVW
jgi:sorbose reductase